MNRRLKYLFADTPVPAHSLESWRKFSVFSLKQGQSPSFSVPALLLTLTVFLAVSTPAHAEPLFSSYVSQLDWRLPPEISPFTTVKEAHDLALDNSKIMIISGCYPESVTFSKKRTISSIGGAVTIGSVFEDNPHKGPDQNFHYRHKAQTHDHAKVCTKICIGIPTICVPDPSVWGVYYCEWGGDPTANPYEVEEAYRNAGYYFVALTHHHTVIPDPGVPGILHINGVEDGDWDWPYNPAFNITYLIVIWGLVIALFLRRGELTPDRRRLSDWITAAFALLALGDTGHVGFRVWAYALGGLDSQIKIFGYPISLVGAGALMTAVTVTLFYVLMLEVWRLRFNRRYGTFEYFLLITAATRLYMLTLSINDWWRVVPDQPWSTIRNIPLMIQGLGLAYLVLRDAIAKHDTTFRWIGICILISYACLHPGDPFRTASVDDRYADDPKDHDLCCDRFSGRTGLHNMTATNVTRHDNTLSDNAASNRGCSECHVAEPGTHIDNVFHLDNSANTDRYVSRTGMTWTDNASNTGTCYGTSGLTGCHSDKGNWYRLWDNAANLDYVANPNPGQAVCNVCHGQFPNGVGNIAANSTGWRQGTSHYRAGAPGANEDKGSIHTDAGPNQCNDCHGFPSARNHDNTSARMITFSDGAPSGYTAGRAGGRPRER